MFFIEGLTVMFNKGADYHHPQSSAGDESGATCGCQVCSAVVWECTTVYPSH